MIIQTHTRTHTHACILIVILEATVTCDNYRIYSITCKPQKNVTPYVDCQQNKRRPQPPYLNENIKKSVAIISYNTASSG